MTLNRSTKIQMSSGTKTSRTMTRSLSKLLQICLSTAQLSRTEWPRQHLMKGWKRNWSLKGSNNERLLRVSWWGREIRVRIKLLYIPRNKWMWRIQEGQSRRDWIHRDRWRGWKSWIKGGMKEKWRYWDRILSRILEVEIKSIFRWEQSQARFLEFRSRNKCLKVKIF